MSYYNRIYGLLLEKKGKKAKNRKKSTGSPTGSTGPTAAPTGPTGAPTGPTGAPTGPTGAPTGPTGAPPPPDEEARKKAARDQYRKELDALPNKDGSPYESPSEYRERMRHNIENMRKRHAIVNPDTGKAPVPYKETAFDRFDAKVGRFNQSVGQVMQSGKEAIANRIQAAKKRVMTLIKRSP